MRGGLHPRVAVGIGVAQDLALIPRPSRSGRELIGMLGPRLTHRVALDHSPALGRGKRPLSP